MVLCSRIYHLNALGWYTPCVLHTCSMVLAMAWPLYDYFTTVYILLYWQYAFEQINFDKCDACHMINASQSYFPVLPNLTWYAAVLHCYFHNVILSVGTVLPIFIWCAPTPHDSFQCHRDLPNRDKCIVFTSKITSNITICITYHYYRYEISLHLDITICILCSCCPI